MNPGLSTFFRVLSFLMLLALDVQVLTPMFIKNTRPDGFGCYFVCTLFVIILFSCIVKLTETPEEEKERLKRRAIEFDID